MPENPYAALGLDPGRAYGDDEVRAAWRRTAAATHPERDDGGDVARFAAAAAAYAELRTGYGRGEARADLAVLAPGGTTPPRPAVSAGQAAATMRRVRAGRPWFLLLRMTLAALAWWGCVAVAGWQPATLAIGVALLTWLALTARHDLAPGSER